MESVPSVNAHLAEPGLMRQLAPIKLMLWLNVQIKVCVIAKRANANAPRVLKVQLVSAYHALKGAKIVYHAVGLAIVFQ